MKKMILICFLFAQMNSYSQETPTIISSKNRTSAIVPVTKWLFLKGNDEATLIHSSTETEIELFVKGGPGYVFNNSNTPYLIRDGGMSVILNGTVAVKPKNSGDRVQFLWRYLKEINYNQAPKRCVEVSEDENGNRVEIPHVGKFGEDLCGITVTGIYLVDESLTHFDFMTDYSNGCHEDANFYRVISDSPAKNLLRYDLVVEAFKNNFLIDIFAEFEGENENAKCDDNNRRIVKWVRLTKNQAPILEARKASETLKQGN